MIDLLVGVRGHVSTLTMVGHDRVVTPPLAVRAAARGGTDSIDRRVATGRLTAWDLFEIRQQDYATEWADRTLDSIAAAADTGTGCSDCADTGYYGLPHPTDDDTLVSLLHADGDSYRALCADGEWVPVETPPDGFVELLDLETAEELASALLAGAIGLTRRYAWPLAFIPPRALLVAAAGMPDVDVEGADLTGDPGYVPFAVVDAVDPGAVLTVLRIGPGGKVQRWDGGAWTDDAELKAQLTGVEPPPVVELDAPTYAAVMQQVQANPEAGTKPTTAGALTADAPLTVSPDPRAEKLRRYWSSGEGAAKIRWGTPGDFTRCVRQLRKYMPGRAEGYCANLHKRNTGVWAGDRMNASAPPEAALMAALHSGRWAGPDGRTHDMTATLADGVYAEDDGMGGITRAITAGGFPVNPPDDWFEDPKLAGPTPLTVTDEGRVYGHIATFDVPHIGMPGRVHAPRSRSGYAFFKTGELVTASGARVNVGQLTLSGGHAPLSADAGQAVEHYDSTDSGVVDMNVGEDRFGIWAAGSLRPTVTPEQVRALRASAPSGDWRPINGALELVAVCQVNVPGFPIARAQVAGGAVVALVAAGVLTADAGIAARLAALEAAVFEPKQEQLVDTEQAVEALNQAIAEQSEAVVEEPAADGEPAAAPVDETPSAEEPAAEPSPVDRVRAEIAERRAERRAAKIAAARELVVKRRAAATTTTEPVAAAANTEGN